MTPRLPLALAVVLLSLSGCGAISSATAPLDAYTLTPARPAVVRANGQHLVVPPAAVSGQLSTDRILVKPSRLQAAYLPKGRWVDTAPVLIQSLIVTSLQNSGGFRLVGRDDAGLAPDLLLLTDLSDFQAEAPAAAGGAWTVRVALTATLVRDGDRSIIATRRFEQTALAGNDGTLTLVNAFDAATSRVLTDLSAWVLGRAR